MCAQSINIIIATDLLLMKIKFTGMLLTKENHISALGRTKQDRANIILPFCVVHRSKTTCLLFTAVLRQLTKQTWQTNLYRAFWQCENKITAFCVTPVKHSVI